MIPIIGSIYQRNNSYNNNKWINVPDWALHHTIYCHLPFQMNRTLDIVQFSIRAICRNYNRFTISCTYGEQYQYSHVDPKYYLNKKDSDNKMVLIFLMQKFIQNRFEIF